MIQLTKQKLSIKYLVYYKTKYLMGMLMKTRLVVLIDFSPQNEVIVKLAKRWSEIINAEILLIHQVTYAVPALADSESRMKIIQYEKGKAIAELNKLIQKHFDKNNSVDYEIFEKNLIPSLKNMLGKNYQDIVMIGTERSGIFKNILWVALRSKLLTN
jgi:hypothetical protein